MLGLYARIKKREKLVQPEEPASRSANEQEDVTRAIHAKVSHPLEEPFVHCGTIVCVTPEKCKTLVLHTGLASFP